MTESAPAASGGPAAGDALAGRLAEELAGSLPDGVGEMADAVRDRHGGVCAVLFYGSCLRRGSAEGILDFYVLVDGYRDAHPGRPAIAALNALLPPCVFYLEHTAGGRTLRAKYAVISTPGFARAASPASLDCRIWSRFCQPSRAVWVRDAATQEAVRAAVVRATLTAVERMLTWLPGDGPVQRFAPSALWTRAFRETYAAELRGEKAESIDALYASQRERFDGVARLAFRTLEARGRLRLVEDEPEALAVASDPAWRARERRRWRIRRPLAKALAVAGIVKTPATFDGWVDYALWKVERHTGVRIELSARQRRHPVLHAAPILWRLWRDGVLR